MRKIFRPLDILPIALILALALSLWLLLFHGERASTVRIYVGNTLKEELVLPDEPTEYTVTVAGGSLSLALSPDGAWVTRVDCPDRLCERTGRISRAGEAIVCVPLGVCITLGENDLDGVTG